MGKQKVEKLDTANAIVFGNSETYKGRRQDEDRRGDKVSCNTNSYVWTTVICFVFLIGIGIGKQAVGLTYILEMSIWAGGRGLML